ncbi:MAG: hypothetical protein ACLSWI_03135 [Candidatus Gastranaerophilaceae bacterium]
MSRKNMMICAGMLLLGGATYLGVMKNSKNRYNHFLTKTNNTLNLPKDTFLSRPLIDKSALPDKAFHIDTVKINSAIKDMTKIIKK